MPTLENLNSKEITANLVTLTQAAQNLNVVSDELGKTISRLDTLFKALNLGISIWYTQAEGEGWKRSFGYARVKGKWGISIKHEIFEGSPAIRTSEESWNFNDAPRYMRIEVISSIPDLIVLMIQRTNETRVKIESKLLEANQYINAMMKVNH